MTLSNSEDTVMADQVAPVSAGDRKLVVPVLIGKAHKLTKNGSKGNVENSRGHS